MHTHQIKKVFVGLKLHCWNVKVCVVFYGHLRAAEEQVGVMTFEKTTGGCIQYFIIVITVKHFFITMFKFCLHVKRNTQSSQCKTGHIVVFVLCNIVYV